MTISVTIEAQDYVHLQNELQGLLLGIPQSAPGAAAPAKVKVVETEAEPESKATAEAAPPRRRRGKGNGTPVEAAPVKATPDPEPSGEESEGEEEADLPSRDAVIDELTVIFKGADPATREKIKNWRNKMGYALIRDITEEDVPKAVKFINELVASV